MNARVGVQARASSLIRQKPERRSTMSVCGHCWIAMVDQAALWARSSDQLATRVYQCSGAVPQPRLLGWYRLLSNVTLQLTADIKESRRLAALAGACYYGSAAAELWR
jgi:hypothetical protein